MPRINNIAQAIRHGHTISDIANRHGVSRRAIHTWLKKNGLDHQKLKFDHDFFANVDNEAKAYWLGFIMADGCVSLTQHPKVIVKLHERDRKHLEKWHQAIDSCINIHSLRDTVSSTHYSATMCEDLMRLGCVPRKSLKLEFPEIREDLVRHFARGYFDGDGYIGLRFPTQKSKKLSLRLTFLGTSEFLLRLKEILACTSSVRPTGSKVYSLELNGNNKAGHVARWMYDNATVFLDRKMGVYHSYL